MIRRLLSLTGAALAAFFFSNCAASGPTTAGVGAVRRGGGNEAATVAPAAGYAFDGGAPRRMTSPPRPERGGLATGWDRRMDDKVSTTIFDRDSGKPIAIAKVFYNDQAGALAMCGGNYSYTNSFRDYAGGIFRAGLRNHRGAALTAVQSGDNLICIGEGGERYTIEVENLSNHRLEFVVTVDGLDVLNGKPGSYANRGYILDPGERREIKGWRTSVNEVAGFKFGSVEDGYANRKTGNTANVGVIGAAVFAEKGTAPKPYRGTDTYRRLRADPFVVQPGDGRFATPPER